MDNIAKGDVKTFNKPVFPKGEIIGRRLPRGAARRAVALVGHQGRQDRRNYQAVVPTTWKAAPRNENDEPGQCEASLLNAPVADPERPLEVLRTIHSFDPCLACAVHVLDADNKEVVKVKVL